jgi:hypothetical protein
MAGGSDSAILVEGADVGVGSPLDGLPGLGAVVAPEGVTDVLAVGGEGADVPTAEPVSLPQAASVRARTARYAGNRDMAGTLRTGRPLHIERPARIP